MSTTEEEGTTATRWEPGTRVRVMTPDESPQPEGLIGTRANGEGYVSTMVYGQIGTVAPEAQQPLAVNPRAYDHGAVRVLFDGERPSEVPTDQVVHESFLVRVEEDHPHPHPTGTEKALQERVEALTEQRDDARRAAETAHHRHAEDVQRIGQALNTEAAEREWCSEFDDKVEAINRILHEPLPLRDHTYEMTVDVTYRVRVSVTATSEDDAWEALREYKTDALEQVREVIHEEDPEDFVLVAADREDC